MVSADPRSAIVPLTAHSFMPDPLLVAITCFGVLHGREHGKAGKHRLQG